MTKQESRTAASLLCFSVEPFLLWQQCHNMAENKGGKQANNSEGAVVEGLH